MAFQKITVLIPCHNEEKGIAKVIGAFPRATLERMGFMLDVIVVDNNSTDKTALVAKKLGATVISESNKGKGNAVLAGFRSVPHDSDYVVMMDGDATYLPQEIIRMIEPLMHDFCDVVVGTRLGGRIKRGVYKFSNRLVNWIITFTVRQIYKANVTDVLSGYYAWKREVVEAILPHLDSQGFSIEMEMIIKMERMGYDMYSVPITYELREGESKINSFPDAVGIMITMIRNLGWKSPHRVKHREHRMVARSVYGL